MMYIRLKEGVILLFVFLCIAQPVFAGSVKKMMESSSLLIKLLIALPLKQAAEYHTVEAVLTGDTFRLDDGRKVRLIGVDVKKMKEGAGRAADERAERKLRKIILGRDVRLELDREDAPRLHRDRDGSILAYVYLKDGTLVNKKLAEQGC